MTSTEYVYATLLLHSARKEITEDNIRKVLEAAGVAVDEVELKRLVAAIKQINIDDVLKQAFIAPVSAPVSSASTAATTSQETQAQQKTEEKEEKKEEISEETIAEGLSALFG